MKPTVRYLLLCLLSLASVVGSAFAQSAGGGKFPVPYGPSNLGKEFYFAFPTNYEDPSADMQYIRLYITAPVRTRVQIYTGTVLKKTVYTVPNDIIQFDLTKFEAQALSRSTYDPVPPDQVYRKKAVHIVADDPIVVYGMNRTSYTSDGMLIFPVNALGTDYVVAAARDYLTGGYFRDILPSQFVITAAFDATNVSIETPMETPNHKAGQVYTVQLNKGDVFSSMSFGPGGDLSGAVINASKPVAVTAGQNCTYLPNQNYPACDHIEEMLMPISTWGTVYHSVPFATRLKGDLYRIFAMEEGTEVYVNGVLKFTLSRRGGPEGFGWVEYLPPNRELLEFSSNKPIMVAQYNNSQNYDGVPSDPFYLALTPVEQFQREFVFSTPSPGDFSQNYMTIVADSAGYSQIEFAKTGSTEWKNLSQSIPRAVRTFYSTVKGRRYVGVTFDIEPAAYKIRGPLPFAAYVYGFHTYDSYGYPLSAALSDLSKPDTIAPQIEKTQDCFGNVEVTVLDLPEDQLVRSNLSSIDIDRESSFNYALDVAPFEAGVAPGTTYKLTVLDQRLDARAIIVISDKAGNTTYDTVTYSAFKVVADPNDIPFGNFFAGENRTLTTTLRNLSTKRVTITETALVNKTQGFTIIDPTGPFTLEAAGTAGATREVTLRFDATVAGDFLDSLTLRDECGFRAVARMTASVGTPIIKVTDKDFGTWPVTAPAKRDQIHIENASTEGGTLIVTGIAQDIGDKVTFTTPEGMPFQFPLSLAAGEVSDPIIVTFKPGAVRKYIDSIVFTHNAPPNPANDPTGILEGEGIQGSLIATNYNWGRRRVGSGPHPAKVSLTNVGSSDVTLRVPTTRTGNTGDFTIVDESVIANRVLRPGESVDLDVTFSPTAVGPREMRIDYEHEPRQTEAVSSLLEGFGTVPGLVTTDYDFGSMDVGSMPETPRTVVFELPAPSSPDVLDSVTILRFVLTGDPDFRADLPTTPIVLKRGGQESVSFTGYFGAQQPGTRRAQVLAVTDDGVDTASHWTGVGLVKDPVIEGTGVSFGVLCARDTTLEAIVTNTGVVPVVVSDLQLTGLPNGFRIAAMPALPVTLNQGDVLRVPIIYAASGNGVFDGFLNVINNSVNNPDMQLRVQGASIEQVVGASVTLSANGPGGKTELGKEFLATVSIDDAVNTTIPVRNYRATITYDPDQEEPQLSRLLPGDANPTATLAVASHTAGTIVIDVTSPTPLSDEGDLLTLPFAVVFNASLKRDIAAEITTTDAACISFATSPGSIDVEPICGLSLRVIEMNETTYALKQNTPNPFNPTTKITYSLGLDGQTKLLLHDAAGKLVQVLIDEVQQPGTYEITLDVTNLPSGMYYYTIASGHWSETKQMMVTK